MELLSFHPFRSTTLKVRDTLPGAVVTIPITTIEFKTLNLSDWAFLRHGRALKIGSRYFFSQRTGPLPAAEAFRAIINPKSKRAHDVELLVDQKTLQNVFHLIRSINECGGMATATVASTGTNWFVVRNLILVGPAVRKEMSQEHCSSRYEINKIEPVGFVSSRHPMIQRSSTSTIRACKDTNTVPIPTKKATIISETELAVPCRTRGWQVNLATTDIDRVDYEHLRLLKRPLHGFAFDCNYRQSKSCCPEILPSQAPPDSTMMPSTLSLLGARVALVDGSDKVRVKKAFRMAIRKAMAKSDVSIRMQESGDIHSAGWKGKYPVLLWRIMVRIDGLWYWFDTLQKCGEVRPNPRRRLRYLHLQQREQKTIAVVKEPLIHRLPCSREPEISVPQCQQ